jgi:putative hydrolase of the HAD superfamily
LQVRPEQAIYVGNDSYHDIFGAQQVGMTAIFVTSDQGNTSTQTISPDYTISSFAELPQAVTYFVTLR